jgi:hypothetical protein
MLKFLERMHPVSGRKLQLFAVACCRRIWWCVNDNHRALVEIAERFADGKAEVPAVTLAISFCEGMQLCPRHAATALNAARSTGNFRWDQNAASQHAIALEAAEFAAYAKWSTDRHAERAAQTALLRHIVGNPFRPRPAFPPSRGIIELAAAVYEGHTATIGPLHDALLDAGLDECAEHFRDPGEAHPKGCWALDRILGKS